MMRYMATPRRQHTRRSGTLSWRMLLSRRSDERRAGWDRRQRAEGMRA